MRPDDVRSALLDIEETIRGSVFENWRKDFVRRHLHQFTFEDENKLIYTDIHREFEEGVETHILEGLPKKFDYEDFQHSLPSYIDGPGKVDLSFLFPQPQPLLLSLVVLLTKPNTNIPPG